MSETNRIDMARCASLRSAHPTIRASMKPVYP